MWFDALGIAGSSLAYQLTRPGAAGEGKKVVLVEAKDIASGASAFLVPLSLAGSLLTLLYSCRLQRVETEVRFFSSSPISASPLTPAPRPSSGHFAPATAALFTSLTKPLTEGGAGVSKEEAIKIILSERENYELAQEIVKKEGMDVDLVTAELAEGASLCLALQRQRRS